MTRWGKAGVRLDPWEAEAARRRVLRKRGDEATARHRDREKAERMWRTGMVVPHRITVALGSRVGPEVDRACGVEEPAVDMWEAGTLYPTFDQLCALAALTGKTVSWFCVPWPDDLPSSLDFHLSPDRDPTPRVHQFSPAALAWAAAELGVRT